MCVPEAVVLTVDSQQAVIQLQMMSGPFILVWALNV